MASATAEVPGRRKYVETSAIEYPRQTFTDGLNLTPGRIIFTLSRSLLL